MRRVRSTNASLSARQLSSSTPTLSGLRHGAERRTKIYQEISKMAEDVTRIYFKSMKLAGPDSLEIENEVGGKYVVDLNAHTARWVSGPESGRQ
jgi:hypothetical protein